VKLTLLCFTRNQYFSDKKKSLYSKGHLSQVKLNLPHLTRILDNLVMPKSRHLVKGHLSQVKLALLHFTRIRYFRDGNKSFS
jgi:hypothetical protein